MTWQVIVAFIAGVIIGVIMSVLVLVCLGILKKRLRILKNKSLSKKFPKKTLDIHTAQREEKQNTNPMMSRTSESYHSRRIADAMSRSPTRDEFIRGATIPRSGTPAHLRPSEKLKDKDF